MPITQRQPQQQQEIEAIVTAKTQRSTSKGPVWDVMTENAEKYSVWEEAMANAIKVGNGYCFRFTQTVNGRFINRNVTAVAPLDGDQNGEWITQAPRHGKHTPSEPRPVEAAPTGNADKIAALRAAAAIMAAQPGQNMAILEANTVRLAAYFLREVFQKEPAAAPATLFTGPATAQASKESVPF